MRPLTIVSLIKYIADSEPRGIGTSLGNYESPVAVQSADGCVLGI